MMTVIINRNCKD